MEVILRHAVSKIGKIGDKVKVTSGFARNFLIPKGLAYPATQENWNRIQKEKKLLALKELKEKEDLQVLAEKINGLSVNIQRNVHDENKIYGSVMPGDIVEELSKQGISVEKRTVVIAEPIKELGVYTVEIRLHPDIVGKLKVWVEAVKGG